MLVKNFVKAGVKYMKIIDAHMHYSNIASFKDYAKDMSFADLHKLAMQREQPFITVPRFHTAKGTLPLSKSFLDVEGMPVTAVYQEKDDIIIRGFESDGEKGSIKITGEGMKSSESCDLRLNIQEKNTDPVYIHISPWEIKTVRLKGFFDE